MKPVNVITSTIKHVTVEKQYAWMPVRLTDKSYIWFSDYYKITTFCRIVGYSFLQTEKISVDEYILRKLVGNE